MFSINFSSDYSKQKACKKRTVDTFEPALERNKIERFHDKQYTRPPSVISIVRLILNTASILQKAEEVKRKNFEQKETRSQPLNKGKSTTPAAESMRVRRPQVHASTPKPRSIESKKLLISGKTVEKRSLDRIPIITKENKEIKESKDNKESKENRDSKNNNNTNIKEEKELKEQKTKEQKVKNGIEKAHSEENARRPSRDDSVRRSSRPSKIRDYAKMIREGYDIVLLNLTQVSDNDDDDYESEDDDEEYGEEPEPEPRGRLRRTPAKPMAVSVKSADSTPASTPRKRGRPRKTDKKRPPSPEATKIKKVKQEPQDTDEEPQQQQMRKTEQKDKGENDSTATKQKVISDKIVTDDKSTPSTPTSGTPGEAKGSPMLLSPTGQTLKKIPVKALPPGIKPLPLPANARPVGQLCEMQIGEKVMKVQKIVMTKEKVEQLAKQGLIEVKAGTMVLKTGYKLAASGESPVKATPTTPDSNKESPVKRDKPTPTRCDLQEES
ncbi:hypothetical protein EVAR_66859_1 [Eumeta japonica]|uniref:Uncharacterized protein n=1 Tax=Eumeta variegata TaxID=151549 RepID=A0A4C1ZP35_EUMVA|nr:hypothetical protein EVAR_66859_1 [Eumeta japonica]